MIPQSRASKYSCRRGCEEIIGAYTGEGTDEDTDVLYDPVVIAHILHPDINGKAVYLLYGKLRGRTRVVVLRA
jgi:hypothetical protein